MTAISKLLFDEILYFKISVRFSERPSGMAYPFSFISGLILICFYEPDKFYRAECYSKNRSKCRRAYDDMFFVIFHLHKNRFDFFIGTKKMEVDRLRKIISANFRKCFTRLFFRPCSQSVSRALIFHPPSQSRLHLRLRHQTSGSTLK